MSSESVNESFAGEPQEVKTPAEPDLCSCRRVATTDESSIEGTCERKETTSELECEHERGAARREGMFPCLSDEEAKNALKVLLSAPRIQVEVAGGILRHNIR